MNNQIREVSQKLEGIYEKLEQAVFDYGDFPAPHERYYKRDAHIPTSLYEALEELVNEIREGELLDCQH